MKSKDKNTLSRIEEAFDRLFTVIVTYEKWADEGEAQRLREPIYKFKDFPNTNPKAIKSFYRQQILALLREVEGELPKKLEIDYSYVNIPEEYAADPDNLQAEGYNTALSEIKAILQRKIKELAL